MRDGFGREITYLRLSVTGRCNLRCRYCMPEEGGRPPAGLLTAEEMLTAVRAAASLGVRKVRVTGGEPLTREDILPLCRAIAAVPGIGELCLTTNGLLLPPLAAGLRAAGVRRVNISLDTLDGQKYAAMTRGGRLDQALDGLRAALEAGFDRVKLNCVLIGGWNDDEIPALAGLTRQYPVDVRFIELMPMGCGGFGPEAYLSCGEVLRRLPRLAPEGAEGVARLYRLPGAQGRVGLIRPLSDCFCAGCSRLRLTADGKILPCLHAPDSVDIRGLDFEGMRAAFQKAAALKPEKHGPLAAESPSEAEKDMNDIGG